MTQPLGIRLPEDILKNIEEISKEEMEDRSTVIRKLVTLGYKEMIKKKAAQKYIEEKITFSEAAFQAKLTIHEMQKFLIEQGFKSDYSLDDLKREINNL